MIFYCRYLLCVCIFFILGSFIQKKHWYTLNTPHFQIFFLKDNEKQAQRMANTLEHLWVAEKKTLPSTNVQKMDFVLRNQQAMANGYVSLAPKRSNFFCFPSQNHHFVGSTDWLDMLAVHELRHVVQFSKSRHLVMGILGGELLESIWAYYRIPNWFWEGDAVSIETAFTQSGRGKIPYFSIRYKINTLTQKKFSYDKQTLGSYQHLLQDHYTFGYYLVTYLRKHYGKDVVDEIWKNSIKGISLIGIWNFSKVLQRITGKTLIEIYNDLQRELHARWKIQVDNISPTPVKKISRYSQPVVYQKPQSLSNGDIIAFKQGIGQIPSFVKIDTLGKETVLYHPIDIIDTQFSVANNTIIWNAWKKHPYQKHISYAVIKKYDCKTKKVKILTRNSRYQSACLSPDGKKIAAVVTNTKYEHALVILNAQNGQIIKKISNPAHVYYFTPQWSADSQQLVFIENAYQKKTLVIYNLSTDVAKKILPNQTANIGCPIFCEDYIIYEAAYHGVDAIYALHINTKKIYQVAVRKYGVYHPHFDIQRKRLLLQDAVETGTSIVSMPYIPEKWLHITRLKDISLNYFDVLLCQENNQHILHYVPEKVYPVKKYNHRKQIINFHSHVIKFDETNHLKFFGISNDILETTQIKAGYHEGITASISYNDFYPNLGLAFKILSTREAKNKNHLRAFCSFPYQLSTTTFVRKLVGDFSLGYYPQQSKMKLQKKAKAIFYHMLPKSRRDLMPKWGQLYALSYQGVAPHTSVKSYFSLKIKTHWPGFLAHHGLLWKIETNFKHIDPWFLQYVLPLFYPEKGIDLWVYLPRVWGRIYWKKDQLALLACADLYFFNIKFPFTLNVGTVYDHLKKKWQPKVYFFKKIALKY